MKVYIIKHKGKDWRGNYTHSLELTFSDNTKIYADRYFYRKKDAKKYLGTFDYPEFFEIVTFKSII